MDQPQSIQVINRYQFPRWPTPTHRPRTSLPVKTSNETCKLGIDNRNQFSTFYKRSITNDYIYTSNDYMYTSNDSRSHSPPPLYQPAPTPDRCSVDDDYPIDLAQDQTSQLAPVRVKSAMLIVPKNINADENVSKNFPKQSHDRRKVTQERKRRIQQAHKHVQMDSETWFQLRQSLEELKRLATNEQIFVDQTNSPLASDGQSYEALKQVVQEQNNMKKIARSKSDSAASLKSASNASRKTSATYQNPSSHAQTTKRILNSYTDSGFEPLVVCSKPLHPLLLTGNVNTSKPKQIRPPSTVKLCSRLTPTIKQRHQLAESQLSTNADLSISSIPSPSLEIVEQDINCVKTPEPIVLETPIVARKLFPRASLKSTIKLKNQIPRCHSAMDVTSPILLAKIDPRFILITDQEHRIESWYHQYPFIVSDDLIQLFQSKSSDRTILAYFVDENQQFLKSNTKIKATLQGKPFHINNDWNKYDLIIISSNIYQQIIIHLQTIINLIIKSSGKLIRIHQINHNEDLKSQVKYICKQFNQQHYFRV